MSKKRPIYYFYASLLCCVFVRNTTTQITNKNRVRILPFNLKPTKWFHNKSLILRAMASLRWIREGKSVDLSSPNIANTSKSHDLMIASNFLWRTASKLTKGKTSNWWHHQIAKRCLASRHNICLSLKVFIASLVVLIYWIFAELCWAKRSFRAILNPAQKVKLFRDIKRQKLLQI